MMKKTELQSMESQIIMPFILKTLPKDQWTHEAHIFTAVWHLLTYDLAESICLMRSRIITYNESVGGQNTATGGYHETLTQFYLKILDKYLKNSQLYNFDMLCDEIMTNEISDRDFPLKYYSKELLFSVNCRATWVEPDLQSLI